MHIKKLFISILISISCSGSVAFAQIQLTIKSDTLTFNLNRGFNYIPATIVNEYSDYLTLVGFRNYAKIADFSADSLLLRFDEIGFTYSIRSESGEFVFDPQTSEPFCPPELDGNGCEMTESELARIYLLNYMSNYADYGTDNIFNYKYYIQPGEEIDLQLMVFIEDFGALGNDYYDITLYYIVNERMNRDVNDSDFKSIPNLFQGMVKSSPVKLRIIY